MKAIHLTAYGNPAQSLLMVEVSEPNAPSANEARSRSRDGDCTAPVVIYTPESVAYIKRLVRNATAIRGRRPDDRASRTTLWIWRAGYDAESLSATLRRRSARVPGSLSFQPRSSRGLSHQQ